MQIEEDNGTEQKRIFMYLQPCGGKLGNMNMLISSISKSVVSLGGQRDRHIVPDTHRQGEENTHRRSREVSPGLSP